MPKKPFFSIFIPAKGRPEYLGDAIDSVLLQGFSDFELIISNNGSDKTLRSIALKYVDNFCVRYVEQPEVLDMPTHWEKVSKELIGEYVLVLTDRSVMKIGALKYLYDLITDSKEIIEVITWPWDIYYDHVQVLSPYKSNNMHPMVVNATSQMKKISQNISDYHYSLPRGLNSCVRNSLIKEMRYKYGQAFMPISPDFSFGFLCLLNVKYFTYTDKSLFVSQGLNVSNGGNSFSGDASPYFKSLGKNYSLSRVPLKLPLVQNSIHQDFLEMTSICDRNDIKNLWNRKNYFIECLAEIDSKRVAGLLDNKIVNAMEKEALRCLYNESKEIYDEIIIKRTLKSIIYTTIISIIRKIIGSNIEKIRRFILIYTKRGINCPTALQAAGFFPSNDTEL